MSAGAPEATALRRFALFAGLSATELERVRRRMRLRVAPAGREIIAQGGEDAGEVYFLISGRAEVAIARPEGASVWIVELGPGEVFGELEAIEAMPRAAEVRALRDCRLAVMPRSAFIEMITQTPELALRMMRLIAERLRRQDRRYVETAVLGLAARLAAELLRRAVERDGALVIEPAPGPSELARAVGARRETVSRALSRLARSGIIARDTSRIAIVDPRALAAEGDRP